MKFSTKYQLHKQSGVTLLEILVSILIGTLLVMAITTMYTNFLGSSRLQQEQSTAQDQANFAFLSLNRSIRMSGAGLCVKPTVDAGDYTHQATNFDFPPLLTDAGLNTFSQESRLHSFPIDATTSNSALGTSLTLTPDSDALLVIYSDSNTRRIDGIIGATPEQASQFHERELASPRTPAGDPVFNYDSSNNLQTTWIMMSDCDHTGILKYSPERFNGKSANILPLPDSGDFTYNFGTVGQEVLIGKLHAKLYFVAKDGGNGISQLYVKDLLSPDSDAQPLATNVSTIHIQYHDAATGNWVDGATRNAANNWDQEWPVRVTLTMNAGKELGDQTYTRVLGIRN